MEKSKSIVGIECGKAIIKGLTAGHEETGRNAKKAAKAIEEWSDKVWNMVAEEFNVPLEVLQKFRGSEDEALKGLLGIVSPTKTLENYTKEFYEDPMTDAINDPRIDKIITDYGGGADG